jgi:hypothetical protein
MYIYTDYIQFSLWIVGFIITTTQQLLYLATPCYTVPQQAKNRQQQIQ